MSKESCAKTPLSLNGSYRWFLQSLSLVLLSLAFIVCVAGSGIAKADPSEAPFNYPSESEEPELAAAIPADPVDRIMHSLVTVNAHVRDGARTEATYGTDRQGTGVVLDSNGLIATVGYLVAEAETVKVTFASGFTDDADVLAYDDSIGIGLLRTRNYRSTIPMDLGDSSELKKSQNALVLPASGEKGAKAVTIGKIKAFTGGWEFMLDNAIHTYPPSTNFSGAALVSENAELLGIGALVSIDIDIDPKVRVPGNVFVPIDALKAVLGELLIDGRSASSLKPWLGFETKGTKSGIKVAAVYEGGPAAASGIKAGDQILAVDQQQVSGIKDLYQHLWADKKPGETIHILVLRDGQYANVPVETIDHYDWLNLTEPSDTTITELAE